ncbi:DUF881 domain-containing protein [Rhodococcus sp. HNM0563]|uniref:DUF881 domain-containing protein n=1 Tax=unclassified Rhodococcus (in: high G+C Gram-positive bacteria) TaxID=192944 RepID=UPI00146EBD9E|nr:MULTISPECIES: DUF881 domain-containing protein [unclassified Rhodococcus (in: high G+C Gram-positive bacteria)]MCK0093547.1 DUF881 domain-containing protein [Rhodococcus sp. F64268]NLU64741.1 DUF881 domain-containing protein [Rhodococcus sp. HNM0563]
MAEDTSGHALSGTPDSGRKRRVYAVLAMLLVALLGTAIATQVKNTETGDTLDSARPADLLVLLDSLNRREAALRQEITGLERTLEGFEQNGSDAALSEARARLQNLSIQLGTVPASGPGVVLTIDDPLDGVGSEVVLDTIQELRAAGADTMQIAGADGTAVRIGVDSWFGGQGGDITVDDRNLPAPYTVTAIGDGPTLAAALNIPGGVVDTVARRGGTLTVEQLSQVEVPALREIEPRQYAQPGN